MPQPDTRNEQHAAYLREKMADRGLKAPALAQLIRIQGEKISDDYIRKLSRGHSELASASIPIREAIRKALRIQADEWEQETGLVTPKDFDDVSIPSEPRVSRSAALSAHAMGYRGPKPERAIPESLKEAARLFGHLPMFEGLGEMRWQVHLSQIPYKHRPTTPEEWAEEFLEVKAKHDPPEVE